MPRTHLPGEAMNRVGAPPFWSVEPVTVRQARVLEALVAAGDGPLAIEMIARSLRLPAGALLVTMRSLQHRGLVSAAQATRGTPAGWTLTQYAVRMFEADVPTPGEVPWGPGSRGEYSERGRARAPRSSFDPSVGSSA